MNDQQRFAREQQMYAQQQMQRQGPVQGTVVQGQGYAYPPPPAQQQQQQHYPQQQQQQYTPQQQQEMAYQRQQQQMRMQQQQMQQQRQQQQQQYPQQEGQIRTKEMIAKDMLREKQLHLLRPDKASPCNERLRSFVRQVNYIFTMFGLTLMGLAIYVLFANWGALDPNFFLGSGLVLLLFGLIITLIAYLGYKGVMYQRMPNEFTGWRGLRIILIYQFCLVCALIAEIYWLVQSLQSISNLRDTAVVVAKGTTSALTIPYTPLEAQLAYKFNTFFFGASSVCNTIKYEWFWSFVQARCKSITPNLSQLACQRCDDYSVTNCAGDQRTCNNNQDYTNVACPYNVCREGLLQYILNEMKPISNFIIAFVIFQIVLIFANCALACYSPRDTDEQILNKNGVLTPQQSPAKPVPSPLMNPQYRA